MKTHLAKSIMKAAFETVYPKGNLEEKKIAAHQYQQQMIEKFKNSNSEVFFQDMVKTIFYSGFRAMTVTGRLPIILKYLGNLNKVAAYNEDNVSYILADKKMIRNKSKIQACIYNANEFLKIDKEYGSFKDYVLSFNTDFPESEECLSGLLNNIQRRFKFIGPRNSRHLLLDYGFPLVKPDVMIMRVLSRLGLIGGETDKYITDAMELCLDIARKNQVPPRFIDELLVKIGQSEGAQLCKKHRPLCKDCKLNTLCKYALSSAISVM